MDPVLIEIRDRIQRENLSVAGAAKQIGVSAGSLERHLAGSYVRSDSLAKYRAWLSSSIADHAEQLGLAGIEPRLTSESDEQDQLARITLAESDRAPSRKHLVVDLFSGCGGMSLGFDLFGRGSYFETVLAIDVERAMVDSFNANALGNEVCRQVNLSDFDNESEILAFYLDHLSRQPRHESLRSELSALPIMSLIDLQRAIAALDRRFLVQLGVIRASEEYVRGFRALEVTVLRQTSVLGFHDLLSLPMSGVREPRLGPLVWKGEATLATPEAQDLLRRVSEKPELRDLFEVRCRQARQLWKSAEDGLRSKSAASGRGQLASSAGRIGEFIEFLEQPVWKRIRNAWVDWRATRDALRSYVFSDAGTRDALNASYRGDRRVAVLLGGPPCQGFSRIGRGKIRSLREHGVHVQEDVETGDARNRLLAAYVLSVAALRPIVFLFENVRHFQAEVKAPEGTFHASEALADAIAEISGSTLGYQVANQIIDCRLHLIPQTRERFFMAGIRADILPQCKVKQVSDWCLSLPRRAEIPLRGAVEGLPQPHSLADAPSGVGPLTQLVPVPTDIAGALPEADEFLRWVTQAPIGTHGETGQQVDAHVIRPPRADDRDLFRLMGPGTRFMDYRCDGSATVRRLDEMLGDFGRFLEEAERRLGVQHPLRSLMSGISRKEIQEIRGRLDGSLSIRLLLENIRPMPGELHHHLLTDSYLAKKEGQHGDWLARTHPDRPSKTIVSHMGKDTYAFIHPSEPRTLSVREAARVQTFPDWFSFGNLGFVDAFRVIGNAVPPLLSSQLAARVNQLLSIADRRDQTTASGFAD